MKPSEVRKRVLSEHDELRELLEQLERAARAVLQGHASAADELRERTRSLEERLRAHFELEERILAPALREADPWGPERVERLDEDHVRQRAMLDGLRGAAVHPQRSVLELALLAWGFARLLREDMEEEERLLLSEQLLRDDIIGIEVYSG